MNKCDLVKINDFSWKCKRCGRIVTVAADKDGNPLPISLDKLRPCGYLAGQTWSFRSPGLIQQVKNYASAVTKWIEAGRPERSDDEMIQLLAICENCEFYNNNRCLKCGCRLSGGHPIVSKLKMATEHCPIGKW